MSAPQFQSVVFVQQDTARIFHLPQKNWHSVEGEFKLTEDAPPEAIDKLKGKNVLVLLSDAYCGHMQFNQENKKSKLTEAAIKQLLEDDYDIDTSAYEFNWQNYTISRQLVQVSVSGVEQDILDKVKDWLEPTSAKKVWLMPFAWFVSTLKTVDPALIAVMIGQNAYVSHHYLGIDDARVLTKEDLPKYVGARQKERKETHLMYLQTPTRQRKAVEKLLKSVDITTQSLLSDSTEDALLDVIQAVFTKNLASLGELLHFEMEFAGDDESAETPSLTAKSAKTAAVAGAAAMDLPKPQPPASLRDTSLTEDEDLEVLDDLGESAETVDEPSKSAKSAIDDEDLESADEQEATTDSADEMPADSVSGGQAISADAAALAAADPEIPSFLRSNVSESTKDSTEEKLDDKSAQAKVPVETPSEKTVEIADETNADKVNTDETSADKELSAKAEKLAGTDDSKVQTDKVQVDKSDEVFASLKNVGGVQSDYNRRYVEMEEKRSWKGPIAVFLLVALTTIVIGGAVVASAGSIPSLSSWSLDSVTSYLSGLVANPEESPEPEPAITPSPEPPATPSPEPTATESAQLEELAEVDKAETSVLILNATGINGLAGRVRTQLVQAGWEDVAVGNATGTYNDATFVMSENEAAIATIGEDLNRDLRATEDISETQASQYDIVIVLADE
jgi:hypothetical protein